MKISIVTVSYNAATEIEATLQSVACQTYNNIEYVVVDGASSDGTLDILGRHRGIIDVLISERDGGIYDAMNKALGLATGDAIIFMNAGDYFYSHYTVELAAEFMKRSPDVDVLYGGIEVRHLNGEKGEFMPPDASEALDFLIGGSLPHQGTFARRSAFARSGPFDIRYRSHADYDWFLKMAADPQITMQRASFFVASFGLGGASSQLEKGERERHLIQNQLPMYRRPKWLERRIEAYQEIYINLRVEVEKFRTAMA